MSILTATELSIIVSAAGLEVLRQIVVGIAIAVCTHHPDFFTAQALAKRRQHADLVVDSIDPQTPFWVLLEDQLAPFWWHDAVERNTIFRPDDPAAVITGAA